MENHLLKAALFYLGQGLPIFPITSTDIVNEKGEVTKKNKSPYVAWEKYQTELPTEADILKWWKWWPEAGIGMATGKQSGFIVVDAEKEADFSLFGLDTSGVPTVETGGGGRHFYCAYEPIGNSVKFAPFYDIRGDGGYVVLPPSGHKSGGHYEWLTPIGAGEILPVPQAIKDMMGARKESRKLSTILSETVQEGGRNDTAASVAGSFLVRFKPGEWETVVWPSLKSWNQTGTSNPLDEKELRAVFDSICQSEIGRRKREGDGIPVWTEGDFIPLVSRDDEDVIVEIACPEGVAQFRFSDVEMASSKDVQVLLSVKFMVPGAVPKPFTARVNVISPSTRSAIARDLKVLGKTVEWVLILSTACEAFLSHLSEQDDSWDLNEASDLAAPLLFPPFLAEGTANLLFADGSTGKTFFALRLAISLATGKPFMGYAPKRTVKTLFVDYEDTPETAAYRLKMLCGDPSLQPIDPFSVRKDIRYFHPKAPIPMVVPALKKIVKEYGVELIIVDSVTSGCGAEAERSSAPGEFFGALQKVGVTSLSIAHVTKGATEAAEQMHAFGSVHWHNLARNVWNLRGEEEIKTDELQEVLGESAKQLGLFHRKWNNGKLHAPLSMRVIFGEKSVRYESGRPAFWQQSQKVSHRIVELLRGEPLGLSRKEIAQGLGENINSLKSSLHRLQDQGVLILEGGHGGVWRLKK